MSKARISLTIDDRLLERIDQLAEAQNVTRSALVERLLREAVSEEEMLANPTIRQMVTAAIGSPAVLRSLTKQFEKLLTDEQAVPIRERLEQLHSLARQEERPTDKKAR